MTTERQAFERAVRDQPAEDSVRLAYADYLDDAAGTVECPACRLAEPAEESESHPADIPCPSCRGSGRVPDATAGRAEFIRLQVEFPHLSQTDRTCPYIREYARPHPGPMPVARWREGVCQCLGCHSVRRQQDHFRDHGSVWFADLPGSYRSTGDDMRIETANGWSYTVRRGFVDGLSVASFDCLFGGECRRTTENPEGRPDCHRTGRTAGLVEPLFGCHPITAVEIRDREPSPVRDFTYYWFNANSVTPAYSDFYGRAVVPGAVWRWLPPGLKGDGFYPSVVAARTALSVATARRCREVVGLDPLVPLPGVDLESLRSP